MPAYKTLTIPPGLCRGDLYEAFNGEDVILNQTSERVALATSESDSLTALSAEITLQAAVTTITVDLQVADTDTDAAYQTLNSVTIATPALTGRIDLSGVNAKFARLKVSALTGDPVGVVGAIGR